VSNESTEYKMDRSGWPSGPWDNEPDRLQWKTRAGLPGLIVRGSGGAWCGYVAVAPGHPDYERDDGEVTFAVHGGITYAAKCGGHVCHVPEPGEPDNVWWLGFDTAHAGDFCPAAPFLCASLTETYRDVAYVQAEVESLAEQLAALS
jgi:hypothetical protein